jgi:hypothetical protein
MRELWIGLHDRYFSDRIAERLPDYPETWDVTQNGGIHDLGNSDPQFPVDSDHDPLM